MRVFSHVSHVLGSRHTHSMRRPESAKRQVGWWSNVESQMEGGDSGVPQGRGFVGNGVLEKERNEASFEEEEVVEDEEMIGGEEGGVGSLAKVEGGIVTDDVEVVIDEFVIDEIEVVMVGEGGATLRKDGGKGVENIAVRADDGVDREGGVGGDEEYGDDDFEEDPGM